MPLALIQGYFITINFRIRKRERERWRKDAAIRGEKNKRCKALI